LFKDTNLKVAFKTTTTVGKLLSDNHTTNKYEQSGIYKMTCQSCQKVYIGQTGRNLITRYKEHIRNIRFNKDDSAFAQHMLDQGQQYRPIEQIMELIKYARKGNIMNIKENYYIYKFKQLKELTEEQKATKDNDNQHKMFDIALRREYTPIINVTGNREINTPHNTPQTSASTNINLPNLPLIEGA
jgi:hypothetical protein